MTDAQRSPDDGIAFDHQQMVSRLIGAMRTIDEPLKMRDLADIAGLSPYYLSRVFSAIVGIPPNEFQTAIRFERAKQLLLTTDASVTDICYEVGYGSLGTFSSRFKHLIGVSPAMFREMPERLAYAPTPEEPITAHVIRPDAPARVRGTVSLPANRSDHVFIGLYPAYIAAAQPIAGVMLTNPTTFDLVGIPRGSWRLMAAALPVTDDPLATLLPERSALVADGGPLTVIRGDEQYTRQLTFRPPHPFEPPVLTALPAFVL